MIWRNTKTGETGEWPWTGQPPDSMAREAQGYSKYIPEMEYTLIETEPREEPEEEVFAGRM